MAYTKGLRQGKTQHHKSMADRERKRGRERE